MIRKIVLIGAATLLSASLAIAQTPGGAVGTSKSGKEEKAEKKATGKKAKNTQESAPGGAAGTSKDSKQKN
jgi:hypothetical protein